MNFDTSRQQDSFGEVNLKDSTNLSHYNCNDLKVMNSHRDSYPTATNTNLEELTHRIESQMKTENNPFNIRSSLNESMVYQSQMDSARIYS